MFKLKTKDTPPERHHNKMFVYVSCLFTSVIDPFTVLLSTYGAYCDLYEGGCYSLGN